MSLKFFPQGHSPLLALSVSGLASPVLDGRPRAQPLPQAGPSPCGLTDEEVGIGRRGTILLLQELVEECGEAGNDGGKGALGQDHEHEERVHEQPQEDAGKPCTQMAVRGQAFMVVIPGGP